MSDLTFVADQADAHDPTVAAPDPQENGQEEEDDDYDPSSVQFQPEIATEAPQVVNQAPTEEITDESAQSNNTEAEQAASKPKKRTVGGFVDDDDDDDDEEDSTPIVTAGQDGASAHLAPGIQPRSVTHTPVNATSLSAPDISIKQAAQDQDSSSVTVHSTSNYPVSNGATMPTSLAVTPSQTPQLPVASSSASVPLPKARLPQDRVGILEDRIAADPRGDTDAWLSLIEEYKQRSKIEEAYETYERFLKIFPHAASRSLYHCIVTRLTSSQGDQWAGYIKTMMENEDTKRAEALFGRVLLKVPHVRCWNLYVDYIRRLNNVATDQTGNARSTVNSAFEFTLKHVGQDPAALYLWKDYINFVKTMPGNISAEGWQDKQKVDTLRKIYRQALSIPLPDLLQMWGEYTNFEMTSSRVNGRKFQNEQMPAYMTAKQAYIALENKIQNLDRSTVPRFPPLPGCEGHEQHQAQAKIWRDWIEWEKEDPLVLKDDKGAPTAWKDRIVFIYRLALMSMRFEPQLWYDAAQFCLDNGMTEEGEKLLTEGIEANPESCLLAFTKADRIESQTVSENDAAARGSSIRQPYDKLINALYDLLKQTKERFDREISEIQERYSKEAQEKRDRQASVGSEDDDRDEGDSEAKRIAEQQQAEIKSVQAKSNAQLHELRRLITSAWVALIRAMRRVQGKGKPGSDVPGSRGILSETRKRGNITSDLYIQCALTEWYCYKDPAALRLFDKGMTLYPTDENFALEYIKHLINQADLTNARTVFEKAVSRLEKEPETVRKAKPLYYFFHAFESKYGELAQIQKLEQRMHDLFPEDPNLQIFAHRSEYENALGAKFDPTMLQLVISPNSQCKPGGGVVQSVEQAQQPNVLTHALPPNPFSNNSPKRPLDALGVSENSATKRVRAASPMKAATSRLHQVSSIAMPNMVPVLPGWAIPHSLQYLLAVLPNARFAANLTPKLIPEGVAAIMKQVNLGDSSYWAAANFRTAGRGLMDPSNYQPLPVAAHTVPAPIAREVPAPISHPPSMQHLPPATTTYPQPPPVGYPPAAGPPQPIPGYYQPPPAAAPPYGYAPPPAANGAYRFY